MAGELKITEMRSLTLKGQLVLYPVTGCISQSIDASATQDDSAATRADTEMVTIYNSGDACNVAIWDTIGTVSATNSIYIGAGERLDLICGPGQYISSKIV